jgi:polysaccharide export outer membrane protein
MNASRNCQSIPATAPLKRLFIFFIALSVSSCGLKSKFIYLYNDSEKITGKTDYYEATIQSGDRLEIKIAGLEPESALPFYFNSGNPGQQLMAQDNPANVFQVNEEGQIDMPVLGTIVLKGLKIKEAESLIKEKLQNLIRVPVVQVRIHNFMVSILGEVKSPGYYRIPNNRITILELLAMAGDISINGNRKEILVIRKGKEGNQPYVLDLTSNSIFNSPAFYLNQNDVVYIRPNNTGLIQPTLVRTTGPFVLSVISILFTTVIFLIR